MKTYNAFRSLLKGFPGGSDSKDCLQGRPGFSSCIGRIPWRRKWQPTPVFLPGEAHGQERLAGYSPRGHKESDTAKRLTHRSLLKVCDVPGTRLRSGDVAYKTMCIRRSWGSPV